MAFGDKQKKIEQLSEEVERLAWAEPYIEDALAIHHEVAATLENPHDALSAAEIAARAVAHVRRHRLHDVYDTLSKQITEEQEQKIFEGILHETKLQEGGEIHLKVEQALRIDPDLNRQLTQRARLLLWQESEDRILAEIKQREQRYVEAELSRQKTYNQYNVDFTRTARIDLASDILRTTYQEGDILEISYPDCNCYHKHQALIYSYAGDDTNVLWQYKTGSVSGVRHSSGLSNRLQLYKLGGVDTNEWGKDAVHTWNTLYANRDVQVQFYTDGVSKIDRLRNKCDQSGSLVANVTLFTPIAHQYQNEQLQN